MKKIFFMAGMAAFLSACNDSTVSTNVDSDTTDNSAKTSTTYVATDGDVTYRDGKVLVWRNNDWVETDEDVTLDNGVIVRRNGRVERDGKVVVLKDGEVVNRSGNFFDRAGNALENTWEDIKEGAKDAGDAIEKGAKKVGDKVDKAVDDN